MPLASASRKARQPRVLRPIRLMIVDDSLVARTAFRRMIESADDLEVVAVASAAEQALAVLGNDRVDVILLDLEMPGMGGLEALPKIIERGRGARILVVSALTLDGAEHTLAALSLGATDTLPKPYGRSLHDGYRDVLLGKIRELGGAVGDSPKTAPKRTKAAHVAHQAMRKPPGVLAFGASTGGVHALASLMARLPARLGIPILVTQHLPAAFMTHFARQLEVVSGREALLAADGVVAEPDRILIAPGHAHMAFTNQAGRLMARLDPVPAANGCMPSVDRMFTSLAEEVGDLTLGVVLTGMGRDGAEGAARIVAAGGAILAQDEASCSVWGMPRAVTEAGLASAVLPPVEIAQAIAASLGIAPCK